MSEEIPAWIANLALDVYKVIQKYNAMPRFQQMINEWAEEHEAEIEKHKEWESERHHHFEERVSQDPRLQNEEAGPSAKGWKFEMYVLHTYEKTAPGTERPATMVSGWVPPELSVSAEPKITHILPLSRDHELNLPEKYAVMAAVYDYGRKGAEGAPSWQWPDLSKPLTLQELSNAKKCLFFECLCDSASKIAQDDECWLKALLTTVEEDIAKWANVKLEKVKDYTDKVTSETLVDRCIRKAKNHRVISVLIVIGIIIIGLGAVVGGLDNILSFLNERFLSHRDSEELVPDITDTPTLTATATVEITILSDKKGKTNHIMPGTYLAFVKGREPLLVMSSIQCRSEQMGKNSVRYTSVMSIEPTSKALNQPLSLLKQTEYVQVCLKPIPVKSHVLSAKALCVFNGNIPIEIQIPPQEMTGEIITVRDVHIAFTGTP
jgi:hypothetical protein